MGVTVKTFLISLTLGTILVYGQTGIPTIFPNQLLKSDAQAPYSDGFFLSPSSPVTWSIVKGSGGLPPGIILDSGSGSLTGTPVAAGQYPFTVQAIDSRGAVIATKFYTLVVLPPLVITPTSLPPAIVNQGYRPVQLMTTGGTPAYSYMASPKDPFTTATLPPGMDLTPKGVVEGTPNQTGVYPFYVVVTDSTLLSTCSSSSMKSEGLLTSSCPGYSAQQLYSITIVDQLQFTTVATLPNGATNNAYSQPLVVTGGQAPYTFKILDPADAPPGLTIDPMLGVLSGTPSMTGAFAFNVQVDDSVGFAVSKVFQVTVATGLAPLQASPAALSFTAAVGGDRPAPQSLAVTGAGTSPVGFTVQLDGGQANTTPQFSLVVSPSSGTTPGGLKVLVDQGSLRAGTYPARILIGLGGTASPIVELPVTLTVAKIPAQLVVAPAALKFSARRAAPGTFTQTLEIRNAGGGGAVNFTASVDSPASWISVNPGAGSTMPNQPAVAQVTVNTAGLGVGGSHDFIKINYTQGSISGVISVPVTLFVADAGAILVTDVVGQRFETQQGNLTSEPLFVSIYNFGDPATTVNWTASIQTVSGGAWLSVSPSSGTSTARNPGMITLALTPLASSLQAGGYYALVQISDPQSQGSPQYVAVILDIAAATRQPRPAPVPEGIIFKGTAGGSPPATQPDVVHTSSSGMIAFQASTSTDDGANWLTVSPNSGQTSTASPASLTISANQAGLTAGTYTGRVNVAIGAELRSVNVTFIVLPNGSSGAGRQAAPAAACTPSKLVLTQTGLTNSFAVPAGWPETLSVALNDDCGNVINSGSVSASFSNGDPALSLSGDMVTGTYSSTWQPGSSTAETTVTVQAASSPLHPASTQITGGVAPNAAPTLAKGGTVNAFYRSSGALASGTVAEVYGSGLASGTVLAQLPLPLDINHTSVLIGGKKPPLFFVSNGQLDIEVPPELQPGRQYNLIVSANGTLTLPDTVILNVVQPGVGSYADGSVSRTLAQHTNGTLVSTSNPAKPGEVLVVYVLGMGATNPAVTSGQQAPSSPLARVATAPTLTVNGEMAAIAFAGLTPGSIGLYQINFTVPNDTSSGDQDLVLTQNGVASNTTKLRVKR